MWRSGMRVGETVVLEWRDIDLTADTLLVRRGKGGRGRTVPLRPDLAALFANWPTSYGPRDLVVALTRKTVLRHLVSGIEHAGLDEESPGTVRQRAGVHSLRHSAAQPLADHRGDPAERRQPVAGACGPGGDAPHLPTHRGQHPLYGGRTVVPVGVVALASMCSLASVRTPRASLRKCQPQS